MTDDSHANWPTYGEMDWVEIVPIPWWRIDLRVMARIRRWLER